MLQRPKIVVIGSLIVDHTLRVPHTPVPGETLTATADFTCLGGKGANQALAEAVAGGDITLIGCVSEDDFGNRPQDSRLNQFSSAEILRPKYQRHDGRLRRPN